MVWVIPSPRVPVELFPVIIFDWFLIQIPASGLWEMPIQFHVLWDKLHFAWIAKFRILRKLAFQPVSLTSSRDNLIAGFSFDDCLGLGLGLHFLIY